MTHETIDTTEAVHQFRQLMQPNSSFRILRLVGEGKMGKSHLLTKVFPHLAKQEYQARCAFLDLGYQPHTVPEILSQACTQCGDQNFESYLAAEQVWNSRPKVDVRGFITVFSHIGISAKQGTDDAHARARHLTVPFIKDVGKLSDKLLVFLFDSIDQASEEMRMWLIRMLLMSLVDLNHVRVVIAGRSLPEAHGSYRSLCQSYHLLPIKDIEAYIAYCQQLNPKLSEQSIRDLTHAFDYIPGLFAEVLPKFPS